MIEVTQDEIMKNWCVDKPLVSICMITYGHEKYIIKALEGCLMQVCDFPFEIVIDDDCSLDSTASIIQKYIDKYPKLISANLRERNIGAVENSIANIKRARGKYVAMCEGDDYWIDSEKLQKEIDLIEQEDLAAVCTKVKYIDGDGTHLGYSESIPAHDLPLSYKYILQSNPVHTCSFLVKKSILEEIEDVMIKAPYGDYVMFLAASYFGRIGFINEVTAVYRKNVGIMHTWSNSDAQVMRIKILDLFYADPRFKKMRRLIRVTKRYNLFKLTIYTVQEHKFIKAVKYYFQTLYYTMFVLFSKKDEVHKRISCKEYLKLTISVVPYSELLYRKIKKIDKDI